MGQCIPLIKVLVSSARHSIRSYHFWPIKCVTFFYVLLLFGHNLVKNAHKSDLFRPKILKWFLYKPNQSVLRYLYISRKIDENTKKRQIWVLPFICTDTIKSTEKILIFTFLSFLVAKLLYNLKCPSVCMSVCPYVRMS